MQFLYSLEWPRLRAVRSCAGPSVPRANLALRASTPCASARTWVSRKQRIPRFPNILRSFCPHSFWAHVPRVQATRLEMRQHSRLKSIVNCKTSTLRQRLQQASRHITSGQASRRSCWDLSASRSPLPTVAVPSVPLEANTRWEQTIPLPKKRLMLKCLLTDLSPQKPKAPDAEILWRRRWCFSHLHLLGSQSCGSIWKSPGGM